MPPLTPLLHGPYHPPALRRGEWVDDPVAGRVQVGGWTGAPISWPRRRKTGRAALILTGDLIRAVRVESVEAIAQHWDVSPGTVWKWRTALGVPRVTEGTRKLLQDRTGVPDEAAARGLAKCHAPDARAKIAATLRGRPASEATRAALLAAAKRPKPEGWGERANAWMRRPKPDTPDSEAT